MNRIFLVSLVGLGALSAAGIAGSRAQSAAGTVCVSSAQSSPMVLVKSSDGSCAVATCVSALACDPQSKVSNGTGVCTINTQDGSTAVLSTGGGVARAVKVGKNGQSPAHVLTLDGVFAASAPGAHDLAVVQADPSDLQDVAEVQGYVGTLTQDGQYDFQVLGPGAYVYDGTPDDAAQWKVYLDHALEAAADASELASQHPQDENWKRASEEARVAQEHARKTYEEAMQHYRGALRSMDAETRETMERALEERRLQPGRSGLRGKLSAGGDQSLEARVEALEKAARGRGVDIDSNRSLEERVAELEKHMKQSRNSAGWITTPPEGFSTTTPTPRAFKLRRPPTPATPGTPPVPPTPMTAPVAPAPREAVPSLPPPNAESTLKRFRRAADATPSAPRAMGTFSTTEREDMTRAMDDLKREAARLREELARMRAEVDRLPRNDGAR